MEPVIIIVERLEMPFDVTAVCDKSGDRTDALVTHCVAFVTEHVKKVYEKTQWPPQACVERLAHETLKVAARCGLDMGSGLLTVEQRHDLKPKVMSAYYTKHEVAKRVDELRKQPLAKNKKAAAERGQKELLCWLPKEE